MHLVSSVRQQAIAQPAKVAYHFMGKDTTYEELEDTIGRFAQGLHDLGVQKGDHVALLLDNTPHFLIALYATMRVGAIAIPVNPNYAPDEMTYILCNGDVKVIIALDTLLPFVEVGVQIFPEVKTFIVCETSADIAGKIATLSKEIIAKVQLFSHVMASVSRSLEPVDVADRDTAIILYTSGTTGHPKGAMLSHQNIYSNARDVSTYLAFKADDRIIATLPVFHVFALTVVINAPLISGATILLAPRFSPRDIFTLVKEQKATVFAGVPTMYNFLYLLPEGQPEDFSTIRLAVSGGASLPVALLHDFEQKFHVRISEGYGLSEASPVTCFNPLDRERKVGSIGTSINNVKNRVVDVNGREVSVGEVGELVVHGPNVMKGYYKLPTETAMAIRDGWLYTGDMAKVDDEGYIYLVDRKKDMIIVGGYNVYPREIEEVLFAHHNVVEAAVVGYPDPNFGEAVHAYVVLKEVAATTSDEIVAYCAKHLVKYKVPKVVEILNELPKNTTGKILRRSLKAKV